MTNITLITTSNDMQLHIEKAYSIIDLYLPFNYVKEVLKKLPKDTDVSKSIIRNVKKKLSSRLDVLNAMVEVALENKELLEKLKKQIA